MKGRHVDDLRPFYTISSILIYNKLMKILLQLIISILSVASLSAKMSSTAEVTNIKSITIKEDKIIIVGDAIFQSRIVTTKENKNTEALISGQPSASYLAQGTSVKFIITRPEINIPNFEQLSKKDKELWEKRIEVVKTIWKDSLAAAKILKIRDKTSLSIAGSDVRFEHGELKFVEGNGQISTKK